MHRFADQLFYDSNSNLFSFYVFSGANLYSLPVIGLNCNVPLGRTCWERKSCKILQFRMVITTATKKKHCMAIIGFFCCC